jgi:arylsulfatase A-like enzyme
LLEEVLRIPLIIKPAVDAGVDAGRVEGVFDSIDLLPTLLELVGHDSPACTGTSRLAEMRDGRPIATHESVGWNVHGLQACLARPPHKLVQTYGLLPNPDGSWTAPDTSEWRELDSDEPCLPPTDAAELERRLEELARVTV